MSIKNLERGYITLFSILIVSALGLTITLSLSKLSISSTRLGVVLWQSNQAKALANACAEKALQQIKALPSFSGTGNLSLGEGECTYTVTDLGGENREITAIGTVNDVQRKVKVVVSQITPEIIIQSWQEVADV